MIGNYCLRSTFGPRPHIMPLRLRCGFSGSYLFGFRQALVSSSLAGANPL